MPTQHLNFSQNFDAHIKLDIHTIHTQLDFLTNQIPISMCTMVYGGPHKTWLSQNDQIVVCLVESYNILI